MGTRTGAKETRKGGKRDGLKQVGRFTDESGIWNGASAAAGLSRPYRIEWLRSNGVTTAPKRGSKLRSRSKEVTPSIGGDIIRIPDGGKKKEKIVSPPDSSQKPRRRFFDPRGILSKNWNKSNCDKVSHVRRNKHGVYSLLLLELEGSGRRSF